MLNGNPLQCSCLEMGDRGAWWASICGAAQSWTRLKRLSSSSSTLQKTPRPCGQAGTHSRSTHLGPRARFLHPVPHAAEGRTPQKLTVAPATPLSPYPWPGDPTPLLQRSCAIPTCAPRRGPGGRSCALGPGGHRLGPAVAQSADFGTISASLEKSLTLRDTTPPGTGRTTQEARTTAEEGVQGQD